VVIPILENISGLKAGVDFNFSHCPERVNPGDKTWTVEKIPRVVGSLTKAGLNASAAFYRSFLGGSVKLMKSVKEAEAVKIVENTFRDINIAFVNELAMSFSRLGIDLVNVLDGASTKPFAFMAHSPGVGVGGHCIPVDPYYLISYAEENGFHHQLLSLARRINERMPKFTAELAIKSLQEAKIPVRGAKVAVLGLAYKPDVDDDRESPSFKLIESLRSFGVNVVAYDPFIPQKSSADSLSDAVSGASAVVIATAHSEFKNMEPDDLKQGGVGIVIDGRNCLSKEKYEAQGLKYVGIGR
jgi:UDP-N-acetyl-D-glucosamine dehydrogenase